MGQIFFYKGDLPDDISFPNIIAVDTETMGLNLHRDRLCLVQIGDGKGNAYLTQILRDVEPVNLKRILSNPKILKIFQYARFDLAKIKHDLGIVCAPVYCTKIAHKLVRPSAYSHGLKAICQELLSVELVKEQQLSDWGLEELSEAQKGYAANDVLYLHELKKKLDVLLEREGRTAIAKACFDFLPTRAELDLLGFDNPDIFEH
ncbi:MAG: ribonuclease D [Alphaproteobacteria bacterium]|nr:ribonuclease D [Alphaproteobacteria bacterium]